MSVRLTPVSTVRCKSLCDFLQALGCALMVLWSILAAHLLIIVTVAVLACTWYNAFKGRSDSDIIQSFKLGVAATLFIMTMFGVVFTVCRHRRLVVTTSSTTHAFTMNSVSVREALTPSPGTSHPV
jgi:Ca2+/H+ antiporter